MQLALYFAEQKTGRCCFMQIKASPDNVEINVVFLKLIYISIVTESLIFIVLQLFTQEKVKLDKKQQNKLLQIFCKQVFCETKQNSQENTCARVLFKYSCRAPACNFIKNKTPTKVFSSHNFTRAQVQWCSKVSHNLLIKTCEMKAVLGHDIS